MSTTCCGTFSSFGCDKQKLIWAKWNQIGEIKDSHGVDPTGLGIWSWICVRGKYNQLTRFVSCYRPVHSVSGTGGTWSQHIQYYQSEGIQDPNPHTLVVEELYSNTKSWMEDGDHVVLGMSIVNWPILVCTRGLFATTKQNQFRQLVTRIASPDGLSTVFGYLQG